MLTVIRNAEVYSPDYLGKKDLLLAFDKIALIEEDIQLPDTIPHEVMDVAGKIIFPGFIDSHVHITGGGGEGSYRTRTPELTLSKATSAGVTTIVGVIGTDGTTRTMPDLIAKARGLEEEGITCYVHTGSYQVPVKTLTGKIEDDIILIDRVIGAGEIAISDHRSSQPTIEEMAKIASAARIGGMLSGKAGIVNVHLGDSPSKLSLLEQVVETTDIPIKTFHPTHINRTEELFNAGVAYAKKGGNIDFTTSTIPQFLEEGEVKCSTGLKRALEAGVPVERITFTSDGQASLPAFNASGEFEGLQIGSVASLYKEVRDAIVEDEVPISDAIKVITKNPASLLRLSQKGEIAIEKDADLVIVDADCQIDTVFARGRKMVEARECLVKGTFE
ncbi:beta-aspartyl-peptidase [Bacillus sp. RAR_GA_16]|uniref:beta-aspartyl-peptidase n=1 Tax=Bacillus sp. RAR_GA_16 TaxID=2876774 RepID=UPI001CCCFDD6|nr:beta-aspartyl-peptidase [Bacillus sp. RAR_GA_16]MCA0173133.1 beta-aspartyl-peptidase [Bacillus sp. RAR_GA_16]